MYARSYDVALTTLFCSALRKRRRKGKRERERGWPGRAAPAASRRRRLFLCTIKCNTHRLGGRAAGAASGGCGEPRCCNGVKKRFSPFDPMLLAEKNVPCHRL